MGYVKEIGDKVREQRLLRGWSQEELAKRTGLSSGHISEIENGQRKMLQARTVKNLSRALEVKVYELLGIDDWKGGEMMIDLNQFYEWQQESPKRRSVTIRIGEFGEPEKLKVWVYDYRLGAGQDVTSIDEIDLEAAKEWRERAELERLRSKYETS